MAAPTTLQALGMGARAVGHRRWLVAPALLVTFLRAVLTWPAPLFALGMAGAGMTARLSAGVTGPDAVLSGAVEALTAPRSICILVGLWLVGLLASAALRVAFLAGALPTLGEELARAPAPRPRFAEGLAFGFAPLLGTALLGFLLELAAQLYALTALLASVLLALHRPGAGRVFPAALLGGGALVSALVVLLLASLAADAAMARTAIVGDRPVWALTWALRRLLARPAAFLLSALILGFATVAVIGSAQAMGAAALGVAHSAPLLLALGPRLMVSVFSAVLAALLELWRLGTIASLACAGE